MPGQYLDPANPPDGLTNIVVISGHYLGARVDVANSQLTINAQPQSVTSHTGLRAVFSVSAQGKSDLGSQVFYQWKRNGVDLAGATTASYITPTLTLADSGARFSCVVSVPGMSQTSQEASLTVLDAASPRLEIAVEAPGRTNAIVTWATPDPGFYLQTAGGLPAANWTPDSHRATFAGLRSQVTVPMDGTRLFRLGHTNVELESIWPDSVVPAGASAGQTAYELGTVFSSTAPGSVRAIRVYVMAGESGVHVGRIWRNHDNAVVGGPYDIPLGGVEGWMVFYLPQAVAIEPDVNYTVTVATGEDPGKAYANSDNALPSPGGNGRSLRYPAAAGVRSPQPGARPTQAINNASYFRDVLFLPSEVPSENLITWELDRPVSYGRGGDGNAYELGTVFRSSTAGTVTGIRIFAISAEGGQHSATIWRNSDQSVVAGPYEFACGANGGVGASAWFTYMLPEPAAIEANIDYTVSVSTGTDASLAYAYINHAFDNAGGNGAHLSYPAGAGVIGPAGSRPAENTTGNTQNASCLRDVLFQAGGSTETETVLAGGAVYVGKRAGASELGTVFQASTPGLIKAIRVYSLASESGAHTARIWRNANNSLVGGPYTLTYGGSNGWVTFELPAAIAIETNVLYTVAVSTGADSGKVFPVAPDGFAGAGSNAKNLAYPALAGVAGSTLGSRPTQGSAISYLRDVVFQPAAVRPRATMGNATDGNFADYITDANTAWVNAMRFKASANMTATVIKAKIDSVPGHYKCAIYSDKGGMADKLLMRSLEKENPPAAWNEFPLEQPLKLTSGTFYWLAIWSDDTNARVYYTSQSGGTLKWAPYAYGDWPDPITLEQNGSTYLYCIYAEGTFD
jgi:hypothetical protein